jgi:hypothetical protein
MIHLQGKRVKKHSAYTRLATKLLARIRFFVLRPINSGQNFCQEKFSLKSDSHFASPFIFIVLGNYNSLAATVRN